MANPAAAAKSALRPGQSVRVSGVVGSELHSQARGRGDVLGRLEAVREPTVDIGNHQAGVKVDALDGTIVDQGGKCVLRAGAFVAADAVHDQLVAVCLDECGVAVGAGRWC